MFDCFGVRFVPPFWKKKPNFQNGQKSRKYRTNLDIILSFLAKPVDKHGITLVHITYLPLMMGEVSLETSPKSIIIQDIIKPRNSTNTTESTTNTNIQNTTYSSAKHC